MFLAYLVFFVYVWIKNPLPEWEKSYEIVEKTGKELAKQYDEDPEAFLKDMDSIETLPNSMVKEAIYALFFKHTSKAGQLGMLTSLFIKGAIYVVSIWALFFGEPSTVTAVLAIIYITLTTGLFIIRGDWDLADGLLRQMEGRSIVESKLNLK